jgi:hypothetical protein
MVVHGKGRANQFDSRKQSKFVRRKTQITDATSTPMNEPILCRNCHSPNVVETPNGILAPFFALRVIGQINLHVDSLYEVLAKTAESRNSKFRKYASKILLRIVHHFPRLKDAASAMRPDAEASLKVRIRVCKDCSFVGPSQVYPLHQLVGLYRDYRSESYNRDRCAVEPSYQPVMHLVGKCQEETDSRMTNLDGIIDSHVNCGSIQTVLDWGGGEGRFVPTSLRSKVVTVLDYSTEELSDSRFLRLDKLNSNQKYDYIQICHVLEHVSEPRSLMLEVVSRLNRGGYLYVELPRDRSGEDLENFVSRPFEMYHVIHEHLNIYSQTALDKLGLSLGLRIAHLGSRKLDFGWTNATVISGLFVKGF